MDKEKPRLSGVDNVQRTIAFSNSNTNLRTFPSRDPRVGTAPADSFSADHNNKNADDTAKNADDTAKNADDTAKNIDITEHLLSLEQVCTKYSVQVNAARPQDSFGLGNAQAAKLLVENGPNTLTPPKRKSALQKYIICLTSLFNLMLIASGILVYIVLAIDYKDNKANVSKFLWLETICRCISNKAACDSCQRNWPMQPSIYT
ncbi:hypothetical protein IW143_002775 [Coemansia sp. RSA 520]|nr:hypothetical protein IW143_002775 [Coemansia sp. RSA 520]